MKCKYCGREVGNNMCYCDESLKSRNLVKLKCKNCHSNMIVPGNKGQIIITCPKCSYKMEFNGIVHKSPLGDSTETSTVKVDNHEKTKGKFSIGKLVVFVGAVLLVGALAFTFILPEINRSKVVGEWFLAEAPDDDWRMEFFSDGTYLYYGQNAGTWELEEDRVILYGKERTTCWSLTEYEGATCLFDGEEGYAVKGYENALRIYQKKLDEWYDYVERDLYGEWIIGGDDNYGSLFLNDDGTYAVYYMIGKEDYSPSWRSHEEEGTFTIERSVCANEAGKILLNVNPTKCVDTHGQEYWKNEYTYDKSFLEEAYLYQEGSSTDGYKFYVKSFGVRKR